jgi:hypothetical protein
MFKLLWILCMGHDINTMYFSEVLQTQIGHILWLQANAFHTLQNSNSMLFSSPLQTQTLHKGTQSVCGHHQTNLGLAWKRFRWNFCNAFNNNYGHIYILLLTDKLVPSSSQNWCPKSYTDANTLWPLSTSKLVWREEKCLQPWVKTSTSHL